MKKTAIFIANVFSLISQTAGYYLQTFVGAIRQVKPQSNRGQTMSSRKRKGNSDLKKASKQRTICLTYSCMQQPLMFQFLLIV